MKKRLDAISILSHPRHCLCAGSGRISFQTLDEAYQHVRDTYRERLAGKVLRPFKTRRQSRFYIQPSQKPTWAAVY